MRSPSFDPAPRAYSPGRPARSPPHNLLLSMLPDESRSQFFAGCESVALEFSEVLWEPGQYIQHVYFPINCVVSLMSAREEDAGLALGIVGYEGMLGVPIILGVNRAFQRVVVQVPGAALRMRVTDLAGKCETNTQLSRQLSRYVCATMRNCERMVFCAHYHIIEARLATWLLMTRDRARTNRFRLTQELLADALGVRREAVTHAASIFKSRGIIGYRRGDITILDGPELKKLSCRCYKEGHAWGETEPSDPCDKVSEVEREPNRIASGVIWADAQRAALRK